MLASDPTEITDRNKRSRQVVIRRFQAAFGAAMVLIFWMVPHAAWAKRDYSLHSGYLTTIDGERDAKLDDVILIPRPPADPVTLQDKIFNDKLVREFRDRYEEKFGRTEVERVVNSPNRFTYYDDLYGFKGTPQEYNDERRRYADFVLRRLAEYHVDNYAQNNPKLRPAWEAKERLKDFKVEVASFRFDMQYSIAGNTFDMKVVNPYLSLARVRLQMDPGQAYPGPVDETIISLGRGITETSSAEAHYALTDGIVSFIARKAITASIGSTLTLSTFTRDHGTSIRESRYLSGISYIF